MNERKVITVDGLAGSGKTTLSKLLAKRLGYAFFSSGAVYRAVALLGLNASVDLESEASVLSELKLHKVDIRSDSDGETRAYLDGVCIEKDIRTPEVSEATSIIAKHPKVRGALTEMQRGIFPGQNLVAEGRDMGTLIFPAAILKFFIEVSEGVRMERRMRQLSADRSGGASYVDSELKIQMKVEITERDKRDRERTVAPTVPAEDAVIIDNSGRSLTEVIEIMYDFASKKGLI